MAGRRRIARAVCLLLLASPTLARADFGTPCVLSGVNGTWEVAQLDLPGGSDIGSFGAVNTDPGQVPFTDRQGYMSMVGFYVINASTRQLVLWHLQWGGAGAPGAKIRVNGTTYYENPTFPTTRASGMHGGDDGHVDGLAAGTYYVVGFGYGASSGALGQGTWRGSINTGVSCTRLSVTDAEIRRFNQTDFTGPTHIYAAGLYGSGTNLSLSVPVSRNTVVGGMYAAIDDAGRGGSDPVGRMQLKYWLPGRPTTGPPSGEMGSVNHNGTVPFVSTSGTYSYTLNYFGFEPLADITFLELNLP